MVFWIIAVVLVAGLAFFEIQGFRDERLSDPGRFAIAPHRAVIYSNGPYGLYGIGSVNGVREPLPQINGKSYDVIYYRTGVLNVFENIYYFVPEQALEALQSRPCRHKADTGNFIFQGSCVELREIPGAVRVASVFKTVNILIELVIVWLGILGGLWAVWRKYIAYSGY